MNSPDQMCKSAGEKKTPPEMVSLPVIATHRARPSTEHAIPIKSVIAVLKIAAVFQPKAASTDRH